MWSGLTRGRRRDARVGQPHIARGHGGWGRLDVVGSKGNRDVREHLPHLGQGEDEGREMDGRAAVARSQHDLGGGEPDRPVIATEQPALLGRQRARQAGREGLQQAHLGHLGHGTGGRHDVDATEVPGAADRIQAVQRVRIGAQLLDVVEHHQVQGLRHSVLPAREAVQHDAMRLGHDFDRGGQVVRLGRRRLQVLQRGEHAPHFVIVRGDEQAQLCRGRLRQYAGQQRGHERVRALGPAR